ncbi:MAG: hypothetical protein ACO294_11450 [Methylococcales bacterium]
MLNEIKTWLHEHNGEITWFLIGFLFLAGIQSFANGNNIEGSIQWGLVIINFLLRPHK